MGIVGTFTGHSISLGVDNGSLDGGLHAQLMIKKNIWLLWSYYIWASKRGVLLASIAAINHLTKARYVELHHHTNTVTGSLGC